MVTWGTPPYTTEGFLLDEEAALKERLSGMTVTDIANSSRSVGVWYSHPDKEKRDQAYPYAVITLVDIVEDKARLMAGRADVAVIPDGYAPPSGRDWVRADYPVPVDLIYQIQTYSRQPRHSRQIVAQMVNHKTPMRGGILAVCDGTFRRMDFLGVAHRETNESNKRLFVSSFTVKIASELTPANMETLFATTPITKTVVDVWATTPPTAVPGTPTDVVATSGVGSASVAFKPSPTSVRTTAYTVTSTPGGLTATGEFSPLRVSGLTAGTPYTFKVVATNAIGDSAPSVASNSVVPT